MNIRAFGFRAFGVMAARIVPEWLEAQGRYPLEWFLNKSATATGGAEPAETQNLAATIGLGFRV